MANRYANIVGSRKISEDFTTITTGFDRVQQDVDAVMLKDESQDTEIESLQTQLNTIVLDGDSSVEAAQARVDANGTVYPALKARLDTENSQNAKKGQSNKFSGPQTAEYWVSERIGTPILLLKGTNLQRSVRIALANNAIAFQNVDYADPFGVVNFTYLNLLDTGEMQDRLGGRVYTASNAGPFFRGSGPPNGIVSALIGSIYTRSDGGANTTIYIKESGNGTNTGWVPK